MQLRYPRTCRIIVVLCAKGSNPLNILFGLHVYFLLDLVPTGYERPLEVQHIFQSAHGLPWSGQSALIETVLASSCWAR